MKDVLKELGLDKALAGAYGARVYSDDSASTVQSFSPIDGRLLGSISVCTPDQYRQVRDDSAQAYQAWREYPAPKRGEIVRQIAERLREKKAALGKLVTLEMGKILAEGEGEIQEAIDIADFAVGLSRQLYGKTMHSERAHHRMYEQWHPLGVVGVITAFNFPAAVWAWNAMIAAVCGDAVLWKPSELTPLTSIAMNSIGAEIAEAHGFPGLFSLVIGDGPELGKLMAADRSIPLVSATGSCRMGRSVGEVVGSRLGKTILELGGNNAIIVCDDADLDLAIPGIVFGSVGTAGQRCTSTRRLLVDRSVCAELEKRLIHAYSQVRIGNPLDASTLMGPLVHQGAVKQYQEALIAIQEQGGKVLCGGSVCEGMPSALYVEPTLVKADRSLALMNEETFAPILYIVETEGLEEAIEIQNSVPQGLSSSIFTRDLKKAERFLSACGSDCGIANVNIGTSGAEIGGAFGGEKDTGGGRESGSDSWKQYMRRQTNTINYSDELPLAQGIRFDL